MRGPHVRFLRLAKKSFPHLRKPGDPAEDIVEGRRSGGPIDEDQTMFHSRARPSAGGGKYFFVPPAVNPETG
jgi:hypothetical protein